MASLPRHEIHRRALLAASKVSLSFGAASIVAAVGCGGQVDEAPAVAEVSTDAEAADAGGTATDTAVALDAVVADAVVADAVVADAAADASACGALVAATLGTDAGVPSPVDPELDACCREILPTWTKDGDFGVSYLAARDCCMVVGGETWWEVASAACTPWGPPMPPEMPSPAWELA